jgi:hypothetical protein
LDKYLEALNWEVGSIQVLEAAFDEIRMILKEKRFNWKSI